MTRAGVFKWLSHHGRLLQSILALIALALGLFLALPEKPAHKPLDISISKPIEPSVLTSVESTAAESLPILRQEAKRIDEALAGTPRLKPRQRASMLAQLGEIQARLGERQLAISTFEEASFLLREVPNKRQTAQILLSLGSMHRSLGNSSRAVVYYRKSLALFRELGDQSGAADTLTALGGTFSELGSYDQALETLEKALALYKRSGSRSREVATLENLGLTYAALGESGKAREFLLDVLKQRRAELDLAGQARALVALGNVDLDLGDREGARGAFERALQLQTSLPDKRYQATTLLALGNLALSSARALEARSLYERVLAISSVDARTRAQTLAGLASAVSMTGDFHQARPLYYQAIELERMIENRPGEAEALIALARTEFRAGNLILARDESEKALALFEALRTKVSLPALRSSFLAARHDAYEFYANLLMELWRLQPVKGYDVLAFEASEKARARSLVDVLSETRVNLGRSASLGLLAQQYRIAGQSERKTPTGRSDWRSNISDRDHPHAAFRQQLLSLPEIQQVLDPDTILLEYSLGEKRSFLWVVTSSTFASYELPPRGSIEPLVRETYSLLTRGDSRMDAAAADLALNKLSRVLLGPIAARLSNKRLAIVADSALQ